ncbi:MAG: cobalamin-binding protein, partial [Candidatus Aenigmarchaeota archaeon]|nr:cobalamin-binding protein [Candidatus Aenigmarchaeota archaeon]
APAEFMETHPYDDMLMDFGRYVIQKGDYLSVKPVKRRYPEFGTSRDRVTLRISDGKKNGLPPLMRAHAGPYNADREEAVKEFIEWTKKLSDAGLLDVLSVGASQLSQEMFGEEWGGRPNGGGVPVNSAEEYRAIADAARPMLVRTYAGTKNRRRLAEMYEETMNMAWHALPFWWFSELDGRGPYDVPENLADNFDALDFAVSSGKPVEPNVPHHFSFRGADDTTYVVSAYLTAKAAKKRGLNELILQTMLNDPKYTWGVNDIAKARSSLKLVKTLEDENFRVYLQPRAGLDYLSHDTDKAMAQLAGVTALMDDIEAQNIYSPDIIHVVSYSEGRHLATPDVINESVQITRRALEIYRELKRKGEIPDMSADADVRERTGYLTENALAVINEIEKSVKEPYSPEGFYQIFKDGYLPVPHLMYLRDEFPEAVRWKTKIKNGSVDVYRNGSLLTPRERTALLKYR